MDSEPKPLSGLPKVIAPRTSRQKMRDGSRGAARAPLRGRATRLATLAAAACMLATAPACSRTARPVPIPDALEPWSTALATSRRDAWLRESAPERPEAAWTVSLGRGVVSPLAIEADLLFATTVDRRLIVIAASTGSIFWERRLAGAATAGAVFDRNSVFVGAQDRDGAAEAYELARGFLVWRKEIQPPLAAPLLHEGVTYWGTETGHLYALGAQDGAQLWRLNLAGGIIGSPIVDGADLLIVTNADTLYRVEMRTGRTTARLPLPSTPTATPAYDGTRLHLPMHDTTHVVIDVPAWRVASADRLDSPSRAIPVLDADRTAYLLTERASVYRVGAAGGTTRIAALDGAARASLALAANGLLVGRLDGALFLIRRDGTTVWREDFDDSIEAPVAVYRGAVYVPMLRGDLTMLREAGT